LKWAGLALALGCTILEAGTGRDLAFFYRSNCAACHGLDGSAKGPGGLRLPGKPLMNSALAKQETETLIHLLREGKGAMPAFKEKLSPEESKRLLEDVVRPLSRPARRGRNQGAEGPG
jgi:mono/diheme cytochrome c family protein